MPIYDYKCLHCGKTDEYIHTMTESPPRESVCCGKTLIRDWANMTVQVMQPFQAYFDGGQKQWITNKRQVKEICARHDKVFAGDKELDQQSKKNMQNKLASYHQKKEKVWEQKIDEALRIPAHNSANYQKDIRKKQA